MGWSSSLYNLADHVFSHLYSPCASWYCRVATVMEHVIPEWLPLVPQHGMTNKGSWRADRKIKFYSSFISYNGSISYDCAYSIIMANVKLINYIEHKKPFLNIWAMGCILWLIRRNALFVNRIILHHDLLYPKEISWISMSCLYQTEVSVTNTLPTLTIFLFNHKKTTLCFGKNNNEMIHL